MKKKWNVNEIKLLSDLYEKNGLSITELYPFFNEKYERTFTSVNLKIKRLKLKHTKQQLFEIKSRLNSGEKNGMFGKKSPMNGLNKENSMIIREKSKKLSETRKKMYINKLLPDISGINNPMYNKTPWNFGLTKETHNSLRVSGKKSSIYQKNRWKNLSDNEKETIVNRLNVAMIKARKLTKIEKKIKIFLCKNDIAYEKNKTLNNFYVDFYLIKYNFVIECDGDYWHVNPKFYENKKLTKSQIQNIERDKRKNKMLVENNIPYLRFWENDIHNHFDMVKEKILNTINSI